jgi:ubiquinone/menaquinone biosynthesis C-methylase UbiE
MTYISKAQAQFGPIADAYVNCPVQSGDFTLSRMIDLIQPNPEWQALDIATGGGHTALNIAKYVNHVTATDVTHEMLAKAKHSAERHHVNNISLEYADSMNLPYRDECYNLVCCRLAPHHFEDVDKFVKESFRVLRCGGVLSIIDSHVPEGIGGYQINEIQKLHDPSHVKCLTKNEWIKVLERNEFEITAIEEGKVEIDFNNWVARARVSEKNIQLITRLMTADLTDDASDVLDINTDLNGNLKFHFQRIIITATKHTGLSE